MTLRPHLIAAIIDKVGVSDTLRFELGQNGATNIPEMGQVKTPEGFKMRYEMSSYAHLKGGTAYPGGAIRDRDKPPARGQR